ncbi:MAG: hypothetical protein KGM97_03755 [Alphaproteobacteria bacterium]|nr:hypothetical protein [Alphaproteobacteria bacterium]
MFYLVNAGWMVCAPYGWYLATPGVVATGSFNPHFVRDIGLAFLASGAMLVAGARGGAGATALALAGAVWPALHGLFHIWEWLTDGFPAAPAVAATELFGVVGAAMVGLWFAVAQARQEGVI